MASTSETGHAKNVANFQTLVNACTGLGAQYQPTNPALQLEALNTQLANCKVANTAVKNPLVAYNTKVSLKTPHSPPPSGMVSRHGYCPCL